MPTAASPAGDAQERKKEPKDEAKPEGVPGTPRAGRGVSGAVAGTPSGSFPPLHRLVLGLVLSNPTLTPDLPPDEHRPASTT